MKKLGIILMVVSLTLILVTTIYAESKKYVVQKGDTLGSIANKELNAFSKWRDIAKWNNLENPNRITPGQVLFLEMPAEDEEVPTPTRATGSEVDRLKQKCLALEALNEEEKQKRLALEAQLEEIRQEKVLAESKSEEKGEEVEKLESKIGDMEQEKSDLEKEITAVKQQKEDKKAAKERKSGVYAFLAALAAIAALAQ